jgi:hypothetical protein
MYFVGRESYPDVSFPFSKNATKKRKAAKASGACETNGGKEHLAVEVLLTGMSEPIPQDSAKGGAVEAGCSGVFYVMHCFIT